MLEACAISPVTSSWQLKVPTLGYIAAAFCMMPCMMLCSMVLQVATALHGTAHSTQS